MGSRIKASVTFSFSFQEPYPSVSLALSRSDISRPQGGTRLQVHTQHAEPSSVQFSSVAQSCPTLCDPMDCSTTGFPVHHQLTELTQTHVHQVCDAILPSHPLSSASPAFDLSQHQGLFQSVGSWHQVAKVLEFQFQHQSFQ